MPEIFEELDRQADKWEPTAAAISLGSLGAGISTTAVGAPIGGIIAGYLLQLQMGIKLVQDFYPK